MTLSFFSTLAQVCVTSYTNFYHELRWGYRHAIVDIRETSMKAMTLAIKKCLPPYLALIRKLERAKLRNYTILLKFFIGQPGPSQLPSVVLRQVSLVLSLSLHVTSSPPYCYTFYPSELFP